MAGDVPVQNHKKANTITVKCEGIKLRLNFRKLCRLIYTLQRICFSDRFPPNKFFQVLARISPVIVNWLERMISRLLFPFPKYQGTIGTNLKI